MTNADKFRNACEEAVKVFEKSNIETQSEIISNLEYCIRSYNYDKNPVGLYEFGAIALTELISYKEKNPRKVNKKIITNLERYLSN
jgi:hypothetical protein